MITEIGSQRSLTTPSTSSDTLGKDVFLNLLITQLRNQDPLEPMEGTEFVTQLAQFSELDELRKLTDGQSGLQNYMSSLNNFAAVSLLGKEVEFSGDQVTWQQGTTAEIPFRLSSEAAQVKVLLYDAQGRLVRTINNGYMAAGNQKAYWNGTDDNGQALASGTYRCDVVAQDGAGQDISAELLQRGAVAEVAFKDGVPLVRIGDRWVSLQEIQGIRMPSAGLPESGS
jgi:flagellar basal-body rod modification protein FlgD